MQALNKRGGAFGDLDEQMLQIFAIHLGNSLSLARLHVSAQCEALTCLYNMGSCAVYSPCACSDRQLEYVLADQCQAAALSEEAVVVQSVILLAGPDQLHILPTMQRWRGPSDLLC